MPNNLKTRQKLSLPAFTAGFALMLLVAGTAGAQSKKKPLSQKPEPLRFIVKGQDGKTLDIAAQKGKIIFLNFWATTCIPCKQEMPTIHKLQEHFHEKKDLLVLPVDLDNNLAASIAFMHKKQLNLTVYTAGSAIPQSLFNGVLPTTVVIGKDGKIARYHEGESDYASPEFFRFIDSLETAPPHSR